MEDISQDDWLNFRIDVNSNIKIVVEIIEKIVIPTIDKNRDLLNGFYFFIESDKHVRIHIRGGKRNLEKIKEIFEAQIKCTEVDYNPPEKHKFGAKWESNIELFECGSGLVVSYYKNKVQPKDISYFLHAFLNGAGFPYPEEIRVGAQYIIDVADWWKVNHSVSHDVLKKVQQKSKEIYEIISKI